MNQLPVSAVLPELSNALRRHTGAVLAAPPGAGKTTAVPLALLSEPWLSGRRIVMLEPRRIAARTAACYMAESLGERVGETIGYRIRHETRSGPGTRIEVVTEGVLTRMLQQDPALENVGLVIFDEFHERNLHADLGLALCLHAQSLLRDDLRILVMSATLEAEPVAALLGDAPVIRSEGRAFPVETRYRPRKRDERLEEAVVRAVEEALASEPGGMLVFLPGEREIRRVQALLAERLASAGVRIVPLYGQLPQADQDRALAPAARGERKIVLSTPIAETSLTVDGVRIVIDSGFMRVPRFSPRTGMTRLETVPVSKANADQRRGRAGRREPGVCYRLWSEEEEQRLAPYAQPEIMQADLAPLALELAAWGAEPEELLWPDPPPAAAYRQAKELLREFGALDERGAITPHGRRMAALGAHPRLAHMMLKAVPLGLSELACETAALLGGRDLLRGGSASPQADFRLRLDALRREDGAVAAADAAARKQALAEAEAWRRALTALSPAAPQSAKAWADGADACGLLLAFAYPDRIGQRRERGRFLLSGGRGARCADSDALAGEEYLVAAELDDQQPESRIFLAAPVKRTELAQYCADMIQSETTVEWDRPAQSVRAWHRERLGALVLKEVPHHAPDSEDLANALLTGIRTEGIGILPWTVHAKRLRQRVEFMRRIDPNRWPDWSDAGLTASMERWLLPHLSGLKSRDDLQTLHLKEILESMLGWEARKELDALAPPHIEVPSGSRLPIDYSDPESPVLAVRLQEMFGLADTPRIANGTVPLTLHLLSPAHRPVQITRDLASFWKHAYFEVKKDLKGRYPKHAWPDDPLHAAPTKASKSSVRSGNR
jgi:ATP-dependent helicase HrpB